MQSSLSQRIEQELEVGGKELDIPSPILANFIAGSFLTLLKWWLENKRTYTAEEMDRIFKQLLMAGIGEQQ